MRPQTPLEVCTQIVSEDAAGALAAIGKAPATKLATRLAHYGETLSEFAAELAGDPASDSEEDARE